MFNTKSNIHLTTSQRYLKLKDDGASEHDPEMRKLRGVLTQMNQNQKTLKEEYVRQQASLQGTHMANGTAFAANGVNGS